MPYEAFRTINRAVDDEIVRQSMPSLGISVSEAEVDEAIVELLGGTANGRGTQPDFQERFQRLLDLVRVSEADYWDFVRSSVLRDKFNRVIRDAVSDMAEQAHVYRLAISPDDEIEEMRDMYVGAVKGNTDPERLG